MNKKIFLISFIGLLAILLILGYGFYVSKGKKSVPPTPTQSKAVLEKGEFAKDCAFLLANENKKGQKKDYLICGQRQVGRTIPLLDKEEIYNYLQDNEDLAIVFDSQAILKPPLKNLKNRSEFITTLPEQTALCFFIYPDLSSEAVDSWEIQPPDSSLSFYKAEVNLALCTKFFKVSDFPSISLVGRVVKEGQISEKFKGTSFEEISIRINIPKEANKISEQLLAGYFMHHPLEFIPIYEISIPLK